jgi:hypothetical protein
MLGFLGGIIDHYYINNSLELFMFGLNICLESNIELIMWETTCWYTNTLFGTSNQMTFHLELKIETIVVSLSVWSFSQLAAKWASYWISTSASLKVINLSLWSDPRVSPNEFHF